MTPAMVTAIAYLIAEAAATGVSLTAMMREVEATGRVSQEQWDAMKADLASAIAEWEGDNEQE